MEGTVDEKSIKEKNEIMSTVQQNINVRVKNKKKSLKALSQVIDPGCGSKAEVSANGKRETELKYKKVRNWVNIIGRAQAEIGRSSLCRGRVLISAGNELRNALGGCK